MTDCAGGGSPRFRPRPSHRACQSECLGGGGHHLTAAPGLGNPKGTLRSCQPRRPPPPPDPAPPHPARPVARRSDHTCGLRRDFAGTIYTGEVTADLLVHDFRLRTGPGACRLARLRLNEPVTVDGVRVTAVDANHCPGAVMLLFEVPRPGGTHNILHTGDCRCRPPLAAAGSCGKRFAGGPREGSPPLAGTSRHALLAPAKGPPRAALPRRRLRPGLMPPPPTPAAQPPLPNPRCPTPAVQSPLPNPRCPTPAVQSPLPPDPQTLLNEGGRTA